MPVSTNTTSLLHPNAQQRLNEMAASWKEMELFHAIQSVAQMLQREMFVVGGVLRDCILGREIHDFDFAIQEDALPFAQLLAEAVKGAYIPLDEIHGSARVVMPDGDWVDITDFRRSTFHQDCLARDFTCNGLSAPVEEFISIGAGAIIDPCNGIYDIEHQTLRMIREENFSEDPLRVLRLYRYAATLGFHIEPATQLAAAQNASKILDVASERILTELQLIIGSKRLELVIEPMRESGIFQKLFPFKTADEIAQWTRQVAQIEKLLNQTPPIPGVDKAMTDPVGFLLVTMLAALKPQDHTEELVVTFRLSNKIMGRILKVGMSLITVNRMIYENPHPDEFLESVARIALLLNNDQLSPWLILMAQKSDPEIMGVLQKNHDLYYQHVQPILDAPPLISGKELIDTIKKEPGPWVSEVLEAIFYNRLQGSVTDKPSAIKFAERYLRDLRT